MEYLIIIIIFIGIFIIGIKIGTRDKKNINKDNYYTENIDNRTINYEQQNKEIKENIDIYPYHSKLLLTKNEYYFYKSLKNITDKANLQILAKIRLADLIEVNNGLTQSEWGHYFSKIKSKHIDFAIADNMKIIMLIEIDDNTHKRVDREKRDTFVENALKSANYTFIRTYGNTDIIEKELYKLRYIQSINISNEN